MYKRQGLARTVRAKDHPAFRLVDLPGDTVENRAAVPDVADIAEPQHIRHTTKPILVIMTSSGATRPLVVLDCDSTTIQDEVIELLAEAAGTREIVAEITAGSYTQLDVYKRQTFGDSAR